MDWKIIELQGYAYYAEKGFRICVPVVDISGYDFIAEKDGECFRVNVKLAGLRDKRKKNSWTIAVAGGSKPNSQHSYKKTCDIFLVFLPSHNRFIELEGSFFENSKSKSKLIPKEYLQ